MEILQDKEKKNLQYFLEYVEKIHGTEKLKEIATNPTLLQELFQKYIEDYEKFWLKILHLTDTQKKAMIEAVSGKVWINAQINDAQETILRNLEHLSR